MSTSKLPKSKSDNLLQTRDKNKESNQYHKQSTINSNQAYKTEKFFFAEEEDQENNKNNNNNFKPDLKSDYGVLEQINSFCGFKLYHIKILCCQFLQLFYYGFHMVTLNTITLPYSKYMNFSMNQMKILQAILCQSKFEQKVFNLAAIETLGYICEELTKKEVTSNEVDQILSAIVLCMKNNISDYDLSLVSIKSLIKTIPLIGIQKMSIVEYSNILMNEIFSLGNTYQTDETVLEHILRIFIEIIENYYDVFEPYHDKMASFVFLMIESQSERLRIMGFEFWCRLGSEELERSKNRRKNYACKFYFQAYFEKLKLIIEKFILPKKADEEEDEWNTSKASCYLLVVLVQVINAESFETIVAGIKETIKSDNHNVIKKSIIILTCSMESIHKTISFQLALQYLYKIAKSLAGTSMDLKLICARALVTITKVIGKYMEPSNLKTLIPLLKDSLFINNKLGISVCTALNNIIVSHGDLNTNRSQNNVSPYFEELIGALAYCDQNLELFDKDNNLAIYCFITMENLIAYSSHDKQNKLMEILANYVMKLNSLQDDNISINGNIKSDLESHYTRLIRFIIVKLFVPLKIPDAQHIYNIIVKTFLKRNIYDEGLLAISSFAISKCYIYIFI